MHTMSRWRNYTYWDLLVFSFFSNFFKWLPLFGFFCFLLLTLVFLRYLASSCFYEHNCSTQQWKYDLKRMILYCNFSAHDLAYSPLWLSIANTNTWMFQQVHRIHSVETNCECHHVILSQWELEFEITCRINVCLYVSIWNAHFHCVYNVCLLNDGHMCGVLLLYSYILLTMNHPFFRELLGSPLSSTTTTINVLWTIYNS